MKHPCSQYFVKMIESSRTPQPCTYDTPERIETRRLSYQCELEHRIGELERRESTWGAAHAGVRQLAYDIKKTIAPGFSVHSDEWTIVGQLRSALTELAAARLELRHLRQKVGSGPCEP